MLLGNSGGASPPPGGPPPPGGAPPPPGGAPSPPSGAPPTEAKSDEAPPGGAGKGDKGAPGDCNNCENPYCCAEPFGASSTIIHFPAPVLSLIHI